MANTLFSKNKLPKKYQSKMSLTANHLQNRMLVIRKNITFYENKTGLQNQLSHFCYMN